MATMKPRITITLDKHVHETISRLARLSHQSKSEVIGGLLETVHQPLMRTVALLEAAAEAPSEVGKGLRGVVESLERQLLKEAGETFQQMDLLMANLTCKEAGLMGAWDSRAATADAPSKTVADPPLVTRGSGLKIPHGTKRRKGGI